MRRGALAADRIDEPAGRVPVRVHGRAKTLAEATLSFIIAFALSFLFMYMILAGQFESFLHPITILLACRSRFPSRSSRSSPRTNLDIYAMFGLFMLFGIVKKNGILQVDYTNVLRQRGHAAPEAILEANHHAAPAHPHDHGHAARGHAPHGARDGPGRRSARAWPR
jgi:multidrug efflux pump subunit AcrB